MDSMFANFWWGFNAENKLMHLRAWDSLCTPRMHGGLGFRRMHDHNRALLSKHAWTLTQDTTRPFALLLKGIYLQNKNMLHLEVPRTASYFWKGLTATRDIIKKGACFRIGSGNNADIWEDPWIPWNAEYKPQRKITAMDGTQSSPKWVFELINQDSMIWDQSQLENLFEEATVQNILRIPLPNTPETDKIIWTGQANGHHTVKNAYYLDQRHRWLNSQSFQSSHWNGGPKSMKDSS